MKKLASEIMGWPLVYRLWQAPFAEAKFAPVLLHNDICRVRRVLDVGCGPGTNTHHFSNAEYLGIDLNERYITDARRRLGREFLAVDAAKYTAAPGERFDFILVNSFLHHIDSPTTLRLLSHLRELMTEDGHVHILELVLPRSQSFARFLARSDRGKFSRALEEWREMFRVSFESVLFAPYTLTFFGIPLWNMVYFKGRAKA